MSTPVGTRPAAVRNEEPPTLPQTRPLVERLPPELVLLGVITVIGAAIRFATLGSQSFWADEALTVHGAGGSLSGMWHVVTTVETTPPLYFLTDWGWAKIFGTSEVALRSLSAIVGTALIPVAFYAGRELVSRAAGLLAAAFTAVSPFMVWYSQEARAYALFALFAGLSFLFWARAWHRPTVANYRWWAVFSVLAVLTHFFAGFLIAPEALLLLYRSRSRPVIVACGAIIVAQLAVLPLVVSDTGHWLGWIQSYPLAARIKQVPVDFGLSSLDQSSLVTRGLIGALVVAAIAVALLFLGGTPRQRRGAGWAALIAGVVLLVPLLLAVVGRDYYVPRNMIEAWLPLAVVLAAACTVPRARLAGGAFALVIIGGFLYAGIRIDNNPQYQRPNLRGVATALGHPVARRAVVAYDGDFAAQPLAVYLHGTPWPPGPNAPTTVNEVDIVGGVWQTIPSPLPAGVRLIARTPVDGYLVARFAVQPAWQGTPTALGARAGALLRPAAASPRVLVQPSGA